jgi:mannose-6-phosphate isomerase-like protein (cupin superfamily)
MKAFFAIVLVVGCGGPEAPWSPPAVGGGDVLVHGVPTDPAPVPEAEAEMRALPFAGVDGEVRVQLALLRLPPGAGLDPPVSRCQDVLALVDAGAVAASGHAIAPREAPVTLGPGDAVRFGPEGRGRLENRGSEEAALTLAFTRARGFGFVGEMEAAVAQPPDDDACAAPAGAQESARVARASEVEPLVVADGKLRVRILLDADRHGARHGGLSILEADPDIVVPEHTHPDSIEAVRIETGEGRMRLGEQQIDVRDGVNVFVPEGILHGLVGAGTRPLRAVQVYAPSGPEQRFREQAR